MDKYDLSLIIPAYNEEKKIEKDIREADKFFKRAQIKAEIIISTDGVTDKTNQIVKKLIQDNGFNWGGSLKLISSKKRLGKGGAIKKGVKIAKGRYVMFADSGLCVPFRFIKDGLNLLNQGYDCALGSRVDKNSKLLNTRPFYRKIASRIFRLLIKVIFGVPKQIVDSQCGFKLYNAKVAKELFSKLKSNKMMFDLEIILWAKKKKYSIRQFPVEWTYDPDSKLNPILGSIEVIKELFNIKFIYKL